LTEPRADSARQSAHPAQPAIPVSLVQEALGPTNTTTDVAEFAGVSIDSRKVRPGELFFGIRGERHDGSAFAADAMRAGAAGVVAEGPAPPGHPPHVPWWDVEDGVRALQRLAFAHRRRMGARVVCVTGSNGKTSTKEVVAAVLATRFEVCRTWGNLNNQVGLPLSLLELHPRHEWAVFELGTNQPGEIARLAALAQPEIGVITNVSASHLEGLSSLEGVVREKTDLAAALGGEGTLVYGGDGELLRSAVQAFSCAKVSFGIGSDNDVHPVTWELDSTGRPRFTVSASPAGEVAARNLQVDVELGEVRLPLLGVIGLLNALVAVAVGRLAGLEPREIHGGLESAPILPLRLEVQRAAGVTVIQDCYNANPESVRRGVETLRTMGVGGARVAVLGGMRELGAEAEPLHYQLGRELAREPLDLLLVYGEDALALARGYQSATGAPVFFFRDYASLVRFLQDRVSAPATVLFKASRGVALDEAAREYLIELRVLEGAAEGV
jgi:UDP-N-acetylmuramoyl-tripeptide--D-alanyl-D-alanine ligase